LVQVLVGRAGELGIVSGFLADTLGEPRALLIDGEPGIGKTSLLREILVLARDRDYRVLSCRPTRSEMDLSYIGLVELLGGVDDEVIDGLPDPQARMLNMVLRREEPEGAFDRLSLGVAVVGAVRAVAATRPVLIAVDDAQWLDPASARMIAFVVRRLTGTAARIAMVRSQGDWSARLEHDRAQPPPGDDPVNWGTELARAMPEGRIDTIRLGPIGASELSRILRRVLGWVPAWPRLLRIAELSAGNPMHALELARAFGGTRSGGDLEGVLPDSVLDLARSRIARLPADVRAAVELASVPRAARLDLLSQLDPAVPDPGDALAAARRSGIVTIDAEQIRFTHPILAAAVYGSIPDGRKRELHRTAAGLCDDPEERARHLATAARGPDARVAAALDEAAERAWRRGAPDAAAELLRLACQLTPATADDALVLRRIAFGRLLHGAGDGPGAIAELEALVASLPPGPARARARYHLMYIVRLSGSLGRAVDHGVLAAAEAAGDPSLQSQVYEMLSRISDDDIERKLDAARKGLQALGRVPDPDPDVVFHVRAALVEAEFYAGLGTHLERLEGLSPGARRRFPPVRTASGGDDLIGRLLTYDGRIEEGLDTLRGMYERASVESRSILPAVLGWMAEAQLSAGRFAAAAELTREAIERAEETGGKDGTPWEVGFHAVALAMLGRLDEAETVATRVRELAEADPSVGLDEAPARLALGIIALAQGRFSDAVAHLGNLDGMKRRAGIREPRLCAHAGDLVEALVGAGELTEAAEILARFEAEAVTSGGQWSLAAAARCQALVLAARGHLDGALAAAERSLSLFDGLPMPFERARTIFAVGQIRRRRREKRLAREALTEALTTFENLQAPVWADRARTELARIPQRRAADGLTPTEETIARLAAEGLTNREIADRAFLSPKTVEVNLTRIYRKLGVRSRAVLASRLTADRDSGRT
jgi:DNA-binding CsgD family transcriptional regulator